MSSKIKEEKRKRKEKEKEEKLQRFALKLEHGPRGLRRKPLKPGALNQLVGSHRLSARYMGGVYKVVGSGVLKSFGVRGETGRVSGRNILTTWCPKP